MKKRNKMLGLLLVICLSLSTVIPVSAATNNQSSFTDSEVSVETYKNWMSSQSNVNTSKGNEYQNFVNEFKNLTEDEQELFVSYISDPDLNINMLNLLSSEESYSTLENGNIVVTNNYTFQDNEMGSRAAIQYRIGTFSSAAYVLGIKVFEYSGEIQYSHDGSTIKEIQHANMWVAANWMPLTTFSWSDDVTYGVGTKVATHIDYCTWNVIHDLLGMVVGTHQVQINGSVYNETTWSIN